MIKAYKSCVTQLHASQYLVYALCFIAFEYYMFVFQFMRDSLSFSKCTLNNLLLLLFYHTNFFMLLWSMYKSVTSDPGRVPLYWGVIMDDPETKKRRYCLVCHQFKPERSHHCTTCGRCVLNMDHHCPWIMNCIGFANRKFFLLMIFYIALIVIFMLIAETAIIINFSMSTSDVYFSANLALRLLAVLIQLFFTSIITNFFYFHVNLLLLNTTTIETMERQKLELQGLPIPPHHFDYGRKYNWLQVFGRNPLLWPFPLFGQSGKPLGDGVTWDKLPLSFDEDCSNPHIVYLHTNTQNNLATEHQIGGGTQHHPIK